MSKDKRASKLAASDLTDAEQVLFENLPGPPVSAAIRSTNIWIIEWLPADEQHTGKLLHEWIQEHRPGWSVHSSCACKKEVLSSIGRVTNLAKKSGMIPVLHLEAHGNERGLGLPDGNKGGEVLTWDELIEPLQELNLATHCNLVLVVAACIGFAGIMALTRGPRSPAVAPVGPNTQIMSDDLLSWAREFYKRWMAGNFNFMEIVTGASYESGSVSFSWEPFAVLAYDAFAKYVIISMRQDAQQMQVDQIRQQMIEQNRWPTANIEHRLSLCTPSFQANLIQRSWDEMFMIDLYPENRKRFGVNWTKEIEMMLSSKCFNRGHNLL